MTKRKLLDNLFAPPSREPQGQSDPLSLVLALLLLLTYFTSAVLTLRLLSLPSARFIESNMLWQGFIERFGLVAYFFAKVLAAGAFVSALLLTCRSFARAVLLFTLGFNLAIVWTQLALLYS